MRGRSQGARDSVVEVADVEPKTRKAAERWKRKGTGGEHGGGVRRGGVAGAADATASETTASASKLVGQQVCTLKFVKQRWTISRNN